MYYSLLQNRQKPFTVENIVIQTYPASADQQQSRSDYLLLHRIDGRWKQVMGVHENRDLDRFFSNRKLQTLAPVFVNSMSDNCLQPSNVSSKPTVSPCPYDRT